MKKTLLAGGSPFYGRVISVLPKTPLVLSLICYPAVYLISHQEPAEGFFRLFLDELQILLVIQIVLSIIPHLFAAKWLVIVVAFSKTVISGIICTPLSNHNAILLLMGLTMLADIVVFLPRPVNFWFMILACTILTLFERPELVWSYTLTPMPTAWKVSNFMLMMFCGMSLWFLKTTANSERQSADEMWRLNLAVEKLSDSNMKLQDDILNVGKKSVNAERHRISREIHDTVGYTLTNIRMMTEASLRLLHKDIEKTQVLLYQMRDQSTSGIKETKQAMRNLRNLDTAEQPWLVKIHVMINTFADATGIKASVEYGNIPTQLPDKVYRVIYRVIQEGLTNSFRHGEATAVEIVFNLMNQRLSLTIRDNGSGSTSMKEGIGFQGMAERLAPLNGSFSARNINNGFELFVKMNVSGESE